MPCRQNHVRNSPAAALNPDHAAGLLSGARPDPVSPTMSVTAAAAVIAAWVIIPLAVGAWRTSTRDA